MFETTFFQHTSIEILISGEAAAYVIYFKKNLAFGNCLFSQRHGERGDQAGELQLGSWAAARGERRHGGDRRVLARLGGSGAQREPAWR
jgi:hypothetical protein